MLKNKNLKKFMSESLNSFIEASINAGKVAWTIFVDEFDKAMSNIGSSQTEEELLKQEVYIDTCSFMHQGADHFFSKYVPVFAQNEKKFNTLSCCIREIEKHMGSDDYQTKTMAQKAKENIDRLVKGGLLNVVDSGDSVFADADFIAVFTKKRIKEDILFITQDGDLSVDVFKLNEMRSVQGHDITVRAFDYYGDLVLTNKLYKYLNGSNEEINEESEDESGEEFEEASVSEFDNEFEGASEEFDDRNKKYGGTKKTKNHINNSSEQASQPQHSVWEIPGREYKITTNPEYGSKYVINGYEVDENTAISYLNNVAAAGDVISVERF